MSLSDHLHYLLASFFAIAVLAMAPAAAFAQDTDEAGDAETSELDASEDEDGSGEDDNEDVSDEADEEVEDEEVDVITVTANRREENLQDTAISVTALDSSFLEEVGLTDFAEIQKFTPNLQIVQSADTRSTSIRIRGIGSAGGNAGVDPTVGVFIDGVYQGRAGMSVQDLLDIDRVEVLRGPQGTLYGKNTAAGAIKVTTKRPDYEPAAEIEAVAGNYSNYEGRFALNIPILDEHLATRVSGYGVTRNGFEKNKAANRYD
jgi:iron complex outermembrane receptor protein